MVARSRAWFLVAVVLLALMPSLWAGPAVAARPQVLRVEVTDADGAPIPTAWVRVHGAEGRRAVVPETGVWQAAVLYDPDGTPRIFARGMRLQLTVTAPGYRPRRIAVRVRSRGNVVPVQLERMPDESPLRNGAESVEILMEEWFRPPAMDDEEEEED